MNAANNKSRTIGVRGGEREEVGPWRHYFWNNGKENGNYHTIIGYTMGLSWDNGKENGNYGDYRDYVVFIWGFLGLLSESQRRARLPGSSNHSGTRRRERQFGNCKYSMLSCS